MQWYVLSRLTLSLSAETIPIMIFATSHVFTDLSTAYISVVVDEGAILN